SERFSPGSPRPQSLGWAVTPPLQARPPVVAGARLPPEDHRPEPGASAVHAELAQAVHDAAAHRSPAVERAVACPRHRTRGEDQCPVQPHEPGAGRAIDLEAENSELLGRPRAQLHGAPDPPRVIWL